MLLQNLLYLFRPDIHQWFLQKSRLKSKTLIGFKSFMFILFMRQIFFIPANEIKGSSKRIERKNRKRRNSKKRLCSSPIKNIYQLVGNIFFKKQWRRMEQGFAANYLLRIIKFCTRIFYKLNLIGCNFKFNFQDVVED